MNPEQIKEGCSSRGYSFGIFKDPQGQVWPDFVQKTDESSPDDRFEVGLLECKKNGINIDVIIIFSFF